MVDTLAADSMVPIFRHFSPARTLWKADFFLRALRTFITIIQVFINGNNALDMYITEKHINSFSIWNSKHWNVLIITQQILKILLQFIHMISFHCIVSRFKMLELIIIPAPACWLKDRRVATFYAVKVAKMFCHILLSF